MIATMYFVTAAILAYFANANEQWKPLSMMGVMKNPKQLGPEKCSNPTNSTIDFVLQLLDLDLSNLGDTTNPCNSSPDTASYVNLIIGVIAFIFLGVVWIVGFVVYVRAMARRRRQYCSEVNGVRYSRSK
uniref:Uncharacterized protein n=1 Tax=Panagrellus redivivus TaxID=6233 RepID=A0A7E4WA59_PANRE